MNKCANEEKDIRMGATALVWGLSLGMLGISIPLTAITGSALIPLAVLLTTGASTVAIWAFGYRNSRLVPSAYQLEDRVANLETIVSTEARTEPTTTGVSR